MNAPNRTNVATVSANDKSGGGTLENATQQHLNASSITSTPSRVHNQHRPTTHPNHTQFQYQIAGGDAVIVNAPLALAPAQQTTGNRSQQQHLVVPLLLPPTAAPTTTSAASRNPNKNNDSHQQQHVVLAEQRIIGNQMNRRQSLDKAGMQRAFVIIVVGQTVKLKSWQIAFKCTHSPRKNSHVHFFRVQSVIHCKIPVAARSIMQA